MRGIGHTLSRLPAARALIAGAAIFAGAAAQGSVHAEEPAARTFSASGDVGLPRPLEAADVARTRRIFRLQEHGNLEDAEREVSRLRNSLLLGHILAQRYLGRYHKASNVELAGWLAAFADHPDSAALRALTAQRQSGHGGPALAFAIPRGAPARADDPLPDQSETIAPGVLRNPALDRTLAEFARDGNVARAGQLLARTKGLDAAYDSLLRAELAQMLFTQNRDVDALRIAAQAFRLGTKDGGRIGLAGYVGGLAAWRLGQIDVALPLFEAAADARIAPASLRAAAAFWAARAHLRLGDTAGYVDWLSRAAGSPRSFYGMLGRRTLELSGGGLSWSQEKLSQAAIDIVAVTPQGWRAFALLQVGEPARAEAELRMLLSTATADPVFGRALLQVAGAAGMIDLATQLAETVPTADGRPRDVLRFHVPSLHPRDGFHVDPALIYALTRLESNFDPAAVSPMGARGLMQIMPVTAGYITDDPGFARHGYGRLQDASINLELGQRYVSYLARQDAVSGDLIRLLACYNAGPGSLQRWSPDIRDDSDPLLFIEAIPASETRRFVQRVLAYTWIYAARLQLPAPSLDELAAGAFPRFTDRLPQITLSAATPTHH